MTQKKIDRPSFPSAVRTWARQERGALRFVPTEEGLIAYHAGELTAGEEDWVRAYLAIDPEAARFVADLDRFLSDAEDEDQRLTEHESARVWRDLKPRIEADEAVSTPAATIPYSRAAPGVPRGLVAAAAVLLTIVGGSLVWSFQMRARVGELEAPKTRIPLREIVTTQQRSSGAVDQRLDIPRDATFFLLQIDPPRHLLVHPAYRLTLDDAAGRSRVRVPADPESAFRGFVLQLTTSRVPAGRYILRLIGVEGDRETVVTEVRVEIVYR